MTDCDTDTIEIVRKTSHPLTWFINTSGVAVDITGWTFWFTIREEPAPTGTTDDSGAKLSMEQGPIVGGTDGLVTFNPTIDQYDLDPRDYITSLRYVKGDGVTYGEIPILDLTILPNVGMSTL